MGLSLYLGFSAPPKSWKNPSGPQFFGGTHSHITTAALWRKKKPAFYTTSWIFLIKIWGFFLPNKEFNVGENNLEMVEWSFWLCFHQPELLIPGELCPNSVSSILSLKKQNFFSPVSEGIFRGQFFFSPQDSLRKKKSHSWNRGDFYFRPLLK